MILFLLHSSLLTSPILVLTYILLSRLRVNDLCVNLSYLLINIPDVSLSFWVFHLLFIYLVLLLSLYAFFGLNNFK